MLQGYEDVDANEWDKVRNLCYFSANSQFFSKPVRRLTDIMRIESIDGNELDYWENMRQKLTDKRKALLNK